MILIRRNRQGNVGSFQVVAEAVDEFCKATGSDLLKDGGLNEVVKRAVGISGGRIGVCFCVHRCRNRQSGVNYIRLSLSCISLTDSGIREIPFFSSQRRRAGGARPGWAFLLGQRRAFSLRFGPAIRNCRLGQPAKIASRHMVLLHLAVLGGSLALPFDGLNAPSKAGAKCEGGQ